MTFWKNSLGIYWKRTDLYTYLHANARKVILSCNVCFFGPDRHASKYNNAPDILNIMVVVLVDEHSDGWDERLMLMGFEAQSVRKLNDDGRNLKTDYSVLSYAKEHNMVLLTRDKENIKACTENNIPCIPLDDDALFALAVRELEKINAQ